MSPRLNETELAELQASDPAAFDLDVPVAATPTEDKGAGAAGDDTTDAAAGADAKPAAAAAAATDDAAKPAAGDADATAAAAAATTEGAAAAASAVGKDPVLIPKERFDEVNGRLKDTNRRVEDLEARNKALLGPPAARDFKAELLALEDLYDNGKIEEADYKSKKYDLEDAREDHRVQVAMHKNEVIKQQKSQEVAWSERIGAWQEANKDFLANELRKDSVARLLDRLGNDPNITDEQLIQKMEEAAFEAYNWKPGGAVADPAADPAATKDAAAPTGKDLKVSARDAANARARTAAAATPAAISGGVGNRGGPANEIDVTNMKLGDFRKLSKAEQEKLLGEGAV